MNPDQPNDQQKYLEALVHRRNQLFKQLLKDPRNTRPALEIKTLDDKIWELRFPK